MREFDDKEIFRKPGTNTPLTYWHRALGAGGLDDKESACNVEDLTLGQEGRLEEGMATHYSFIA